MLRKFAIALALSVAGLAGCQKHSASPPAEPKHVAAGAIGSRLPEFSVNDLRGKPISSADLRGRVVLVDFWATWCEPCKQEMPGYQRLADKYGPSGFAVIGFKLDTMADSEDPLQFARKIAVHYPLAVGTEEVTEKFGGIEGLPTTLLYDRQGVLRNKVIGFEYTQVFENEIKKLL